MSIWSRIKAVWDSLDYVPDCPSCNGTGIAPIGRMEDYVYWKGQHAPNTRRGFGERNTWGKIVVGNLFAYRATDIRELATAEFPIGPENDRYLIDMVSAAHRVVVAWGCTSKLPRHLRERWRQVVGLLELHFGKVSLLSIGAPAKDGSPCHPLMLSYERPIVPWVVPE